MLGKTVGPADGRRSEISSSPTYSRAGPAWARGRRRRYTETIEEFFSIPLEHLCAVPMLIVDVLGPVSAQTNIVIVAPFFQFNFLTHLTQKPQRSQAHPRRWSKLTSIMNRDLLELYSDYLLSAF